MPISVIPGFLIYCYIGAITPGPANICSLSAAARYGRRAALRQWWGLFVGFAIVSFSSVAVSLLIGNAFSEYIGIFSVIGAAYVMYMAVNTLRGSSMEGKGDLARPTFRKGILIELTNVKVMIYL